MLNKYIYEHLFLKKNIKMGLFLGNNTAINPTIVVGDDRKGEK